MKRLCIAAIALTLVACQNLVHPDVAAPHGAMAATSLQGIFDNHEQVWLAHEGAPAATPPSHVTVAIEPTAQEDWAIWHIRLDVAVPIEAFWAMHRVADANGARTLVPSRALVAAPAPAATFDARQWVALDACALHGTGTAPDAFTANADIAACTAIVPGIGAQAPLLPLGIERDGDLLHLRLYADQARGAEAREDTRKVRWFSGWAAVNGSGPKGEGNGNDWHMDRALRIGSEGGRYALKWRDGSPAGYSLVLERLTYREGNVPVLKLSVVDDTSARTLAYAWADPEATTIGLNLGWVQVGLGSDNGS